LDDYIFKKTVSENSDMDCKSRHVKHGLSFNYVNAKGCVVSFGR